jgi:hypothetical protein
MKESSNPISNFFGVYAREETYMNLLYLLLAFPLSILYFVFVVTGLSVGVGLIVIWIGLPILLAVLAGVWGFALFERTLANTMLKENIPPMTRDLKEELSAWEKIKAFVSDKVTWKSLLYMLLKFPVATIFFSIAVTAVTIPLGFISTLFLYNIWDFSDIPSWVPFWQVDTLGEALIAAAIGLVILGPIALIVVNYLAKLSGALAKSMLSRGETK